MTQLYANRLLESFLQPFLRLCHSIVQLASFLFLVHLLLDFFMDLFIHMSLLLTWIEDIHEVELRVGSIVLRLETLLIVRVINLLHLDLDVIFTLWLIDVL